MVSALAFSPASVIPKRGSRLSETIMHTQY